MVVDRAGQRLAAAGGLALVAVGMALTGLAPSYALAAAAYACSGIGSAVVFAAMQSQLPKAMPQERMARTLPVFYGAFNLGIVAGGLASGVIADRLGLAAQQPGRPTRPPCRPRPCARRARPGGGRHRLGGLAIWLGVAMAVLESCRGFAGVPPGAMLADIMPREAPGAAVGVFHFASDLAFTLGPLVAGFGAAHLGLEAAFALTAIPTALALIAVVRGRETLRR